MTSLAAQLAQTASLNTALLADRSKRKPTESYLFTGRDADQHDLDAIFALGTNGFLQLCTLEPGLRQFEKELFSDRAKALDRTLLGKEEDEKLRNVIKGFLGLLGPWLLESPAARVLEWLVRRFRINEFDVEGLLALFLPYHDTPQFAKLVTILHIKPNTTWSFLLPFKSASQSLPRVSLVTEMLRNTDVSRFVTSLLPSALKEKRCHRVLLAFNAATLHEFISRSKSLDEGTVAYLLSALLEPLEKRNVVPKDAVLGSYILLSALSHKCDLSPSAVKNIVGSMTACADAVATKQYISAVIAVCEPQTELEHFSSSTIKTLLKLPDLKEELQSAVNWAGSEKLIRPLIPALISRLAESGASVLLESIISTPFVPTSVIDHSTRLLLEGALSGNEGNVCRPMLSIVQQRHPDVFERITRNMEEEDEEQKQAIEQLVLSLSLVSTSGTQAKEKLDMILASTNADTNVRVIAVNQMLSSISTPSSITEADQQSITSALLSRIQDPDQQVLETLYDKPVLIAPLVTKEASTYIQILREALSVKTKRSFLRLHLNFVTKHVYPMLSPQQKQEIVSEVLFPFLLFSKPRQHTAETVWDIIAENLGQEAGMEFEALKGCAEVVKAERAKSIEDPVEQIKNINSTLSNQISQNILMSNRVFELLPLLLSWLENSNPHTRCLGYLTAQALLAKLSREHQLDLARRILDVMKVDQIGGMDDIPAEDDQFIEIVKEIPGKSIVLKPTKQTTLSWLQISLVTTICGIAPPEGLIMNWLSDAPPSSNSDVRNSQYVALMRSVYRLANSSSSLPVLMSSLLRILFLNLKGDALAFLAGVWTAPGETDNLHEISLRHAAAFLEAHVLEDDGIDFQTILPTLLIVLQHPTSSVRKAALECLSRLRLLVERKLRSVYKFDVVYGDVKDILQYLDQDDLKKYLSHLISHQQHITQDNNYLRITHGEHLKPVKGDKKKVLEYKNRILCYLLSHVNGIDSSSAKVKILESVSLISTSGKVIELLPEMQALLKKPSTTPLDPLEEKLICLLLSCIDSSSAPHFNDADETLWSLYLQILKKYLVPGSSAATQEITIRLLENEIFAKLTAEKQVIILELIIELAIDEPDSQSYFKKFFSKIVKDVPVIVRLLNSLAPIPRNTPRASKRVKTTESPEMSYSMSELSLLAEILGTKPLPGSLELVSVLLDTLGKVIQNGTAASPANINYIQQMLMSAIDNAAFNILEAPNVTPSVIRLDILVEVIRVAENPQTFHQALLLIASLARLAPESVLHNVMPVFTFMGSNIFHRDDTYSFRVVQKTIDGVVPVMASSLKNAHTKTLDLYIASKDFLRVFTDAANHIPRHRRNNFFVHFVEVLGPDHFLAPVCMLLAEKSSNRVAKQNQDEASNALSLPITLLRHFPPRTQLLALVEMIEESQRLFVSASDLPHKVPTLLDVTDGDPTLLSIAYTKRALALVTLIGQTIQPSITVDLEARDKEQLNLLVSGLISLATSSDYIPDPKHTGLAVTSQITLKKVLASMPVANFIAAITSMLEHDNRSACIGALDILYERLPKIADHARREITSEIIKIVEITAKLLSRDDPKLKAHCLMGLEGVALTSTPKEETSLTAALPSVIGVLDESDLVIRGLEALVPLTIKLGPRIIPFFKDIIKHSTALLKSEDETTITKTTTVLHGLLLSIPGFWGSDAITQIVKIYIDHCLATSDSPRVAMTSLIKAITKKIPSTMLLPTLLNVWSNVSTTSNFIRISAYFNVLTRAIRGATRAIILEQIRVLTKVFLEAFDIVKSSNDDENKAETHVLSAFKEFVIKLNESTFRPIFRRFYDWAFVDGNGILERKIIFFRTYSSLLDFFKALMVPYTSFLLQSFINHLATFTGSDENPYLWISLITTLTKSLAYDDGVFWRNDKLRQVALPLIQQLPFCIKLPVENSKATFQKCLEVLVEDVSDDALLKSVNLDLLMHTRSESVKVRQFALTCSETLWRTHGSKLLGFVAETATFIAECGEDENDLVVKESFKLKDAVESIAGKIDGL